MDSCIQKLMKNYINMVYKRIIAFSKPFFSYL